MEYKILTNKELKSILSKHRTWLKNPKKGERADLSYTDLSLTNFKFADLRGAIFYKANLICADFSNANLSSATLTFADVCFAYFSNADLSRANLCASNFRHANFTGANLNHAVCRFSDFSYADLTYTKLNSTDFTPYNFDYADLRFSEFSYNNVIMFHFERDIAYFSFDGFLSIGYKTLNSTEWVNQYKKFVKKENYTKQQIKMYRNFFEKCFKLLEEKKMGKVKEKTLDIDPDGLPSYEQNK